MSANADVMVAVAARVGADDVLVLRTTRDAATVVGGAGRGSSWAGIVTMRVDDEPHLRAALSGKPRWVSAEDAERVAGPYWAPTAVLVPVGDEHLVIFGGPTMDRVSDGELVTHAAAAVAAAGGIPPDKLLADELEVVHAVRAIVAHRPASVADAARHVARVAADALSCDIGIVLLATPAGPLAAIAGEAACECPEDEALLDLVRPLAAEARRAPVVEQDVEAGTAFGGLEIVSRLTLTLNTGDAPGTLVLAHRRERPRGFTSLCVRIGRSIAEAASELIGQAVLHEQLAAERDRFETAARTDGLTGLGNRTAWDVALAGPVGRGSVILLADVVDLKITNDRHGHAVGDRVIRGAAESLRAAVRDGDLVARLGGDEFGVLLPNAGAIGAEAVVRRIDHSCQAWTAAGHGPALRLSVGWAVHEAGETLAATQARADERLRADKRQHRVETA